MRFGVSVFPGTWSDVDCYSVINDVLGYEVDYVWHKETDIDKYDCIVIPGGFSYGDYLRCGSIASLSPIMNSIKDFAILVIYLYDYRRHFTIMNFWLFVSIIS